MKECCGKVLWRIVVVKFCEGVWWRIFVKECCGEVL